MEITKLITDLKETLRVYRLLPDPQPKRREIRQEGFVFPPGESSCSCNESVYSWGCLGEGLASMELFLFFTSLFQNFCFTPPPGVSGDELDLKRIGGNILNPSPHKFCLIKRS